MVNWQMGFGVRGGVNREENREWGGGGGGGGVNVWDDVNREKNGGGV